MCFLRKEILILYLIGILTFVLLVSHMAKIILFHTFAADNT